VPAVIFGVIPVARPALGLVTLVWLIRADAVAIGIAAGPPERRLATTR
jgi:uncharacterized membrane protein HdeD (DUF308 family)